HATIVAHFHGCIKTVRAEKRSGAHHARAASRTRRRTARAAVRIARQPGRPSDDRRPAAPRKPRVSRQAARAVAAQPPNLEPRTRTVRQSDASIYQEDIGMRLRPETLVGAAALALAGLITVSCGGVNDPSQNQTDTLTLNVTTRGGQSNIGTFNVGNSGEYSV